MVALTVTTDPAPPDRFLIACGVAEVPWDVYINRPNIGAVPAFHALWEKHKEEDALVYLHSDVTIHDANWLERLCLELMDPQTAIVGFGGAIGIGVPDIYKLPYRIEQLIRIGYRSNQTGWKIHGENEVGECKVAVLDGFAMAFKGSFLRELGGWSWIQSNFHTYDLAMCLEAYRRGYNVKMVGVSCEHHGGGTSTKKEYATFCREHATTMEDEHSRPHVWLYNRYRDMLPLRV